MPPKQSVTLTEAELRIMEVLWREGSGTVQQVVEWLSSALAYNSVLTTIRILEKKGYLEHAKDGRFFLNSHEALVLNILQDEALDPKELTRLRKMLERSQSK